jgi:CHAT domain-containing protein
LEVNQAQSLRQNLTTEDQALLDQLIAARSRLAQLIFNKPKALLIEDYRLQVATLQAEISQLENRLFKQQVNSDTAPEPVTIEAVQQAIPERTALVEWVRYTPFNPKAKSADEEWGSPRYAAYILYSQGEPLWVDLGEAEAIEQAVLAFGRALRNPIRLPPVKQSGRTLDALIMQPVRELLAENTDHLLLSPDSQLNLIPFAALVDERDRYLVEAYRLTYLTSGRDLLRLQHSIPSSQVPVLIANPDYERPGQPPEEVRLATSKPGEENRRSAELANLQFDSLPGTAEEADAIALLLPEAIVLTQSQATENALKQVQSPRLLHIATHGFFLKDVQPPTSSVTLPSLQVVPAPGNSSLPEISSNGNVNPLLRSGLALAGFNPRKSSGEDGVLTAFEATGLNLLGTQLVVLSACETGLGDVVNGEGVYGLRRAFVIAGAESQMISLWKVSDSGTKDLMSAYYQKLLTGEGRSEALQKTQLELLQTSEYRHPYYWAAFIFSGNWKSLESP